MQTSDQEDASRAAPAIQDHRPGSCLRHLWEQPLEGPLMRLSSRVYILGSLAHLWLGDAWQLDWAPWNILYLLGLVTLARSGPVAIAWLLCAMGALGPLLFARDVLTQSVILFLMAMSALIACLRITPDEPSTHARSAAARADHTLQAWRAMTIVVYVLAALHKLNHDFFNPAVSCAQYGWGKLLSYWGVLTVTPSPAWGLPLAIITTELMIAALLWRRPRWAWPLAIAFHIPLTLTMAPAFAFVMAAGLAASISLHALDQLREMWRRHHIKLLTGAAILTALSQSRHYWVSHEEFLPTLAIKELAMWTTLGLSLLHARYAPRSPRSPEHELSRAPGGALLVWSFAALMLVNGLSPYLGVQAQHAGAMLSNLRVDQGCWNSLLLPESVRLREDYIRIERAQFGHSRYQLAYAKTLTSQLWSPPQLRQMRKNWCKPLARPFMLQGSYRDRSFIIHDLCDLNAPWAFHDDGVFGVELFPHALRFQKNLLRKCPQACIH